MNSIIQSTKPYQKDAFDFGGLLESASRMSPTVIATVEKRQKNVEQAYETDFELQSDSEEMEKQYEDEVKDAIHKNKDLKEMADKLEKAGYTANAPILYTLKNAEILNRPILIEGEPGVGKTSLAKAYAEAYGLELIKVQFYNGITSSDILYEYDYAKQMLYMNALRNNINEELNGLDAKEALHKLTSCGLDFFGKEFLIERPLLRAIAGNKKCVLLLDEIDKSEEDVEFMLLEILDTFSITIPEYGTVSCAEENKPIVFLTSNRYRELSEAMKRRCLYLYIEPKTIDETAEIIIKNAKVPENFALNVANKVNEIRRLNLKQKPSISDAISWAVAMFMGMGIDAFDNENVSMTLGALLKNKTDIEMTRKAGLL